MKIFIVRHGEAEKQDNDHVLTNRGLAQAKHIAKILKKYDIQKVFCSELTRAKQTCSEFLKLSKLNAIYTPELNEIYRVILGGPERIGTNPMREKNDKIRADTFYEKLMGEDVESIVIFTHGNLIRYYLSKGLNISPKGLWNELDIAPGSVSIIENDINGNINVPAISTGTLGNSGKTIYLEE